MTMTCCASSARHLALTERSGRLCIIGDSIVAHLIGPIASVPEATEASKVQDRLEERVVQGRR